MIADSTSIYAAYYIAFGPHGPRAELHPLGSMPKLILAILAGVSALRNVGRNNTATICSGLESLEMMSTSGTSEGAVGAAPCRTPDRIPPPLHPHHRPRTTFFALDPLRRLIHPAFLLLPVQTCSQIANPYPLPNPLTSILPPIPRPRSGSLTSSILMRSNVPRWRWRR